MELDEALKASKMPMIVVHFDDNFETTHTEEYNMENSELAEWQIESLARMLYKSLSTIARMTAEEQLSLTDPEWL